MNTLMSVARNIRHCLVETEEDGEQIVSEIEAVLTTFEKSMEFVGGSMVNTERMTTNRFVMSPKAARSFAKSLEEWADSAEEQYDRLLIDGQKEKK